VDAAPDLLAAVERFAASLVANDTYRPDVYIGSAAQVAGIRDVRAGEATAEIRAGRAAAVYPDGRVVML
jgi:hypothetical protein